MSAIALNVPEGTTIFIEHVHIDMSLKSTNPQVDGMIQDSMDDSFHGNTQDGFFIDEKYSYNSKFAVEGYSEEIINGWGFAIGGVGGVEKISSERLTEKNLKTVGEVYASKMSVIYDVLVKNRGEEYYHTISFIDEFLIPVPSLIETYEANDEADDEACYEDYDEYDE